MTGAIAWLGPVSAHAQSLDKAAAGSPTENKGYLGVLLGPTFPDPDFGTRFTLGAHGGFKLHPYIGLGGYFTYSSLGSQTGSVNVGPITGTGTVSAKNYILAVEPNFFPLGDNSLYIGGKVGVSVLSATTEADIAGIPIPGAPSTSTAYFAFGPAVGYRYAILPNLALGAEVNYLITTTPVEKLKLLNALASVDFVF